MIEPLGVVRRAGRRAAAGCGGGCCCRSVGLLALAARRRPGRRTDGELQRRRSAWSLLLVGVTALLPWVVEGRRAGSARAGSPGSWPSAGCSSSSGPARAVSGITVAVAGAIALQMLFTGVQDEYKRDTGADLARATLVRALEGRQRLPPRRAATRPRRACARRALRAALAQYDVGRDPAAGLDADVASCATLRELGGVTGAATATSSSAARAPRGGSPARGLDGSRGRPGGRPARRPDGPRARGVFATPRPSAASAARPRTCSSSALDPPTPDAIEQVRNTAAASTRASQVKELRRTRPDAPVRQYAARC